jgi:type IV pilus modification protein PilV
MHTKLSAQSGFSMVELLVAVLVLAIGLLGLAELQITAIKVNSQSETMLAAAAIAQGIVEEIAAMDSSDPMFNSSVNDAVWDDSPVTVEGGGTYDITYDVATTYQGVTNLCLVTVTVESTSILQNLTGNKTRKVVVSTVKLAT